MTMTGIRRRPLRLRLAMGRARRPQPQPPHRAVVHPMAPTGLAAIPCRLDLNRHRCPQPPRHPRPAVLPGRHPAAPVANSHRLQEGPLTAGAVIQDWRRVPARRPRIVIVPSRRVVCPQGRARRWGRHNTRQLHSRIRLLVNEIRRTEQPSRVHRETTQTVADSRPRRPRRIPHEQRPLQRSRESRGSRPPHVRQQPDRWGDRRSVSAAVRVHPWRLRRRAGRAG